MKSFSFQMRPTNSVVLVAVIMMAMTARAEDGIFDEPNFSRSFNENAISIFVFITNSSLIQ